MALRNVVREILGNAQSPKWAHAFIGEKHFAGPLRADNADVFLEDFFQHLNRERCRRSYREEREHPEYLELGGEA